MDKIEQAKDFLRQIGMPQAQQNDICAYTLLTLANIRPNDEWSQTTNGWIKIHDILSFCKNFYDKKYAENTRETIRKNCMHQFREGALIEDNGKPTNSPNYMYRITEEALPLLQAYESKNFADLLENFYKNHKTLIEKYTSKKKMEMMPVKINSQNFQFSPGSHNQLQKAIIEEFAPRFAPNSECLYVGDTIKKDLIKKEDELRKLGFEITLHDKMPDVVLYCSDKKWLYFIEAVTSVGPMSQKRINEINQMTKNVSVGKIFVTAFPDFATYKKFSSDLAWETEVWISELPEHMIHLNGNKFLGPRKD